MTDRRRSIVQGHTEKIEVVKSIAEPNPPRVEQLGKYEIHEKIGEGGFGVVYKGFDPFIKRFVAIKTCNSPDKKIRDRYFREAEIAGRLDHPNIVRIYDFGVENDTPFLVQEFLAGHDLDHKVEGNDFVPYPERLLYLIHIARGLDYAHAQGVIHRDIKPANIRILDDGTAKIMDFGVAMLQHSDHRLTEAGMTVGTAAYLAPEQIQGKDVDGRTDIFSFGVLTHEILSGQRPFDQDNISATLYAILNDDPRPITLPESICPEAMHRLILDCLEKHPEGRPPDFSTVLRRLEAVRRGMRLKTGSRDFNSELRRITPRRTPASMALALNGGEKTRSGEFDPPLQHEWTPNSIPIPERRSRRSGLALAAILAAAVAGYGWMASRDLAPLPSWSETTTPPETLRSMPEESLEPPASESSEAEIPEPGIPSTASVVAPVVAPVVADATVHLEGSWHDQTTVAIDGGKALRLSTARSHKIEPGDHTFAYSLVTPEYRVFETVRLALEAGEERRLKTPIPRPGTLKVQASLGSPQGLIQVGKQTLGSSPLRDLQLRPGRHRLRISAPSDPTLPLTETTIDIKSSRETVVTFDLTGQRDVAIRYRDLDSKNR
jgi:serine/threonine protein kinase